MSLRTVRLYGKLGKLFGQEWVLDVSSVGEALRAINANTRGEFQKYLTTTGAQKHYQISIKDKNKSILKEEINTKYEDGDIFIIPKLKATGKNGLLQTILGIVLIVVGVVWGGGTTIKFGIALTLGGIAQMLMPLPKDTERKSSFLFEGNSTTTIQGVPVGIVYGRTIVTPMPVSLSLENFDLTTHNGDIIGITGLLNEVITTVLYSYRGGVATLCGLNEFTDASIPPKKYRKVTFDGYIEHSVWYGGSLYFQCRNIQYGFNYFDESNCQESINGKYDIDGNPSCLSPESGEITTTDGLSIFISDGTITETSTEYTKYKNKSSCPVMGDGTVCTYGDLSSTLSDEDTEDDAIRRLINSSSWSPWQEAPAYPIREQRTTGFSFYYYEVKTKTVTEIKYNPNIIYKYSYTIQRRIAGSNDPWVDAESINGEKKPNQDGDFEFSVDNIDGYQSKITSIIITI